MSVYVPGLVNELINRLVERGYKVEVASMRMGHEILAIEKSGKRVLLWLRSSPVTRRALNFFNKVVKDFEYDAVLVTKKSVHANPAKLPDNWVVIDLSNVDRDDEAIRRILEAVDDVFGER